MHIDEPNDETYDRCIALAGSPRAGFLRFIGEKEMPPTLKHTEPYFDQVNTEAWLNRVANEYVVFKMLVDTALEKGFSISIPGDLLTTDSREEIMGWFGATDEVDMHFHRPETLSELGAAYLVFGNEGYDLIADHSTGSEMTDFITEVEQRITAHTPDVSMVDMDNLSVVEYTNAVMCLWEYAFDSMNSMTADQSDFGRALSEYKSHNGIRATRELFNPPFGSGLPAACHHAWKELHDDGAFGGSLDAFVPIFAENCIDASNGFTLRPDYMSIAREQISDSDEPIPTMVSGHKPTVERGGLIDSPD